MNTSALFLILFGVFLLFILFFIESGSSDTFSGNFSKDSTLSNGNCCIAFSEIFLTIIVVLLLVVGFVMYNKQPVQNYPVSNNYKSTPIQNYITPDNINSTINSGKKIANNYSSLNNSYNSLKNVKNVSELGRYASTAEATEGLGALVELAPLLAL